MLTQDPALRNAMANSDRQNAKIEHDKTLERLIRGLLADQTELYKQFYDNESFRQRLSAKLFAITYRSSDRDNI